MRFHCVSQNSAIAVSTIHKFSENTFWDVSLLYTVYFVIIVLHVSVGRRRRFNRSLQGQNWPLGLWKPERRWRTGHDQWPRDAGDVAELQSHQVHQEQLPERTGSRAQQGASEWAADTEEAWTGSTGGLHNTWKRWKERDLNELKSERKKEWMSRQMNGSKKTRNLFVQSLTCSFVDPLTSLFTYRSPSDISPATRP